LCAKAASERTCSWMCRNSWAFSWCDTHRPPPQGDVAGSTRSFRFGALFIAAANRQNAAPLAPVARGGISCPGVHLSTMTRSPWSWQPPGSIAVVSPPPVPVDADIVVPGSKSFTNRALLVAALAEGDSTLTGVLRSDDSYWAVQVLRQLGVAVQVDGTTVHVRGCGGRWPVTEGTLYVGSAGTLARFLPPVLAAAPEGQWIVDGSEQLRRRPIVPLVDALRQLGARVDYVSVPGQFPLRVTA